MYETSLYKVQLLFTCILKILELIINCKYTGTLLCLAISIYTNTKQGHNLIVSYAGYIICQISLHFDMCSYFINCTYLSTNTFFAFDLYT